MRHHDVRLRAPSFLGGGPSPVVIRRTDQRFIEGLFRDLKTEEGREHIKTQVLPQADDGERVLYLPIHRCFNLVLAEAYCDTPGSPRLDPDAIDVAGVVLRRRRAVRKGRRKTGQLTGPERWVTEHGRVRGWLPITGGEAEEDPESKHRRQLTAGRPEIDRALALRREVAQRGSDGPFDESFTELFIAPPDVCEALGTTLLLGLVEVADPVVAERPRPRLTSNGTGASGSGAGPAHTSDEVRALLPIWLRERTSPPSVPGALAGRTFRVANKGSTNVLDLVVQRLEGSSWVDFEFPEPWQPAPGESGSGLRQFMRMLWQVRIELQAFSGHSSAKPLLRSLKDIRVDLPSGRSNLARVLEDASLVFVMLEEGATVELPSSWPAMPETSASQIVQGARGTLSHQLSRLTQGEGRFDEDGSRYDVRTFVRYHREDGCPPALSWSETTDPYRVAKWFEGGPDDAVLPTIELPTLDRGFLKTLRPNVSMRVPRTMFNFLNNNVPEDLLQGKAKNDTRGPAIAWICGFNISIIFIIAFMLLITFVFMLNIAFWWVAFFRICIPLPAARSGDEA